MKFAFFLELLALSLFIWAFVSQIAIPVIRNTQIFPFFFSSKKKVITEIAHLRDAEEVLELERVADDLKASIEKKLNMNKENK